MAKRNYPKNGFPSVTQVISQLRSPALEYWFKSHTLEEINQLSGRGKEIGTQMHQCIQDYIETGEAKIDTEYPEEISTALKSFQLFRTENPDIKLKRSEIVLSSLAHGFNGTVDCLSDDMIVDWKSSNAKDKDKPDIYFEAKIQFSDYCYLINEYTVPRFKKALIVSIAKDKIAYNIYLLNEQEIEQNFNEVFKPLLKIHNYRKRSKQ